MDQNVISLHKIKKKKHVSKQLGWIITSEEFFCEVEYNTTTGTWLLQNVIKPGFGAQLDGCVGFEAYYMHTCVNKYTYNKYNLCCVNNLCYCQTDSNSVNIWIKHTQQSYLV